MKTIICKITSILCLATSVFAQELPTAEEVNSISIRFHHPEHDMVEFNCTPAAWDAIRSHLLPTGNRRR